MSQQGSEKTERASPKRREDERKKGNVFMSKDVTTIVSLLVSFFTLRIFIGNFYNRLHLSFVDTINRIRTIDTLTGETVMRIAAEFIILFATNVLPVLLIISIAVIISVGAQTRFLFSGEQIKFKFERISPLKGMQRLFSLRSLVELAKSILKIILLIWLLYGIIERIIMISPNMLDWTVSQAVAYTGEQIMGLVITTGIAFGVIAAADYLYQWWEYEKNIRMTKQEVKEEYKQLEGNPEVKSARRQKQRDFAQRRMMQQVPQADVVVRNPTHFAVALRYRPEEDAAPVVLAKGQDFLAQRIIEEAAKHNITMVENPPLARGLYKLGNIDEAIPAELFEPVAELLAWLFVSKQKGKKVS